MFRLARTAAVIGAFEKMASLSGLTKPDCAEFLAHVQDVSPSELGTVLGYLLGRLDGHDAAAWVGALRDMHPQQDVRVGAGKLTINMVGTGGGPPTFNITTTASFVVAAAGLVVIKTGSGAWRSQSGFADLAGQLRTLKIPMSWNAIEDIAREIGIVHVPPYHHAPVLTELALKLGLPTFRKVGTYVNLTGPLLSPVKVGRRFFGVGSRGWIEVLAEACQLLGDTPTTLCYSDDGLDEVSPRTNSTLIQLASDNQRTIETIDPRALARHRGAVVGGVARVRTCSSRELLRANPKRSGQQGSDAGCSTQCGIRDDQRRRIA
jgi:anthranilate phosphoribosyltransferase